LSEPERPLPKLTERDTAEFWARTKQRKLSYQKCADCGGVVFYPRRHCTHCLGNNLEWHTASGKGTVYTFSVIRQSYHPFFRTQVPYAVAWIDLDEGPRILSNVVGLTERSAELEIGQVVMVEWEPHEELSIPLFKPV
jgi:uncharacterized OB-fold protein